MPTLQITDLSGKKSTLEANSVDTLMESLRDNLDGMEVAIANQGY